MKVAVILGSTRDGRLGDRVAKWVMNTANEHHEDNEAKLLDLLDYDLPFFREPGSPRYTPDRKVSDKVKHWLDDIAAADAYIFVTPEYNRSFPGELKNAIDTIAHEADKKPAAIVSYSATPTGGLAAQEALRQVINFIEMIPIPSVVTVPHAGDAFDENGQPSEAFKANQYGPHGALQSALVELKWYSDALAAARQSSV
jgi:NAD(P)H-dependent FMN reductase